MTNITRRQAATGLAATGILAALPANAATTHQLAIKGFKFDPADLSVKAGDSVVFTNLDGARHTATADNGSFDTGSLKKGATGSVAFSNRGDITYFCKFHRNMKAVIRVG